MQEHRSLGVLAPVALLRLEGLCALSASAFAYHTLGFGWWQFGLLFLVPDLSMLGYLAGKRMGAALYNLGHTYVVAASFGAVCWLADVRAGVGPALIWIAHIGFDRGLGYGLKQASGFGDTHLGVLGRQRGSAKSDDR